MKTQTELIGAVRLFGPGFREPLELCAAAAGEPVCEIRAYAGKAVAFQTASALLFCHGNGALASAPGAGALRPRPQDLKAVLDRAADFSPYLHRESLSRGFLTRGGCRIGVCGAGADGNYPAQGITSLNIRIPYSGRGEPDPALLSVLARGGGALVVGAPGTGKTTLLRHCVFWLASGVTGVYRRTAVLDVNGEFSPFLRNAPEVLTADLVPIPDPLSALLHAVRLLSPEYVVCDELGGEAEAAGIAAAANAGICFLASVHAADVRQAGERPAVRRLIGTGLFRTVLELSPGGRGRIGRILTREEAEREICGSAAADRACQPVSV